MHFSHNPLPAFTSVLTQAISSLRAAKLRGVSHVEVLAARSAPARNRRATIELFPRPAGHPRTDRAYGPDISIGCHHRRCQFLLAWCARAVIHLGVPVMNRWLSNILWHSPSRPMALHAPWALSRHSRESREPSRTPLRAVSASPQPPLRPRTSSEATGARWELGIKLPRNQVRRSSPSSTIDSHNTLGPHASVVAIYVVSATSQM